MASIIRIKRSSVSGNPATLGTGELAYSAYSGAGGNRLYIGMGTETTGNAVNHLVIGGTYYTGLVDASVAGTLTTNASSIPVLSATGTIDKWLVGNLQLTGNTLSSTNTNGNIVLTPNGTGYVSISGTNGLVLPSGTTAQQGPAVQGAVRLNTTTGQFEGYAGSNWSSLGGVRSVDGLTYIIAETSPGSSDDTLHFYAATGASTNTQVATLDATKLAILNTTASTSSTTGALTVAGGVGIAGDLYVGGNLNLSGTELSIGSVTFNNGLTLSGTTTPATEYFRITDGAATPVTKFLVDTANGNTTISGTLGVTGATTLSSTLGVTGATTLSSTLAVTGATTLSSALTYGGVTLSNSVTGTGSMVLSASPTFTGTAAFAAVSTSGNATVGGTLGVTGNTTLSGTLGVTGATTLSSTLGVTGDFSVATNKFTVASATGNTAVAGTLGVTGATTLAGLSATTGSFSSTLASTGDFSVATNKFTVAALTGNTAVAGTLAVTGDTTLTGDIAVNGGDITTTATTFNLINTTATTLNIGGAATSLTLGATTGTATIRNTTVAITNNATVGGTLGVTGNTTLSGTLGVTGATTISGILNANGGITATGSVSVTAGGSNTNINLVPQGTGTVDVASKRITNLAEPTQATDAATKNYVDAVKTGLDPKDSNRVATTGALTVAYSNGTSGVGATLTNAGTQAALTIDSIVMVVGDRVLVKNQATASQNGIYTVTNIGSASTNWVLTRSIDADTAAELTGGAFTFIEEGTTNGDNGFVCTTDGSVTIGTTNINWVQFSGAGQVIAGAGLTKTGNQLDVVGTANRIDANADNIDISANYVGQSSITTLGTISTGTWQGTVVNPTYGGTGVNNGSNTLTLAGSVTHAGAFARTFTATGTTSVTLPTTGTLATLAGTETFTNKTLTSPTINSGAISGTFTGSATLSGVITLSNTTDATSTAAAGVVMSGGLAVAKAIYVGTNITGAGAATSTLDGFQIDGGTY